jgi:hypothetical protein
MVDQSLKEQTIHYQGEYCMIFRIPEIINRYWGTRRSIEFEESFASACSLIENNISNQRNIALVYGPPGTGKTTVYEKVIHEMILRNKIEEDELLVYIAPTNQLLCDMLARLCSIYSEISDSPSQLKEEVRLYGSRFRYDGYEELGGQINSKTKIVLTTDYQSLSILGEDKRELHIMVDEASKSPLHTPFIPLANYLLERGELSGSFNVIGDPNQAIGLGEEYSNRRDLLLLPRLTAGLLYKEAGVEIDYSNTAELIELANYYLQGYFSMLKTTYRMPHPAEQPVSIGYYAGYLRAKDKAEERLKDLWDLYQAYQVRALNDTFANVVDVLEDAIETRRPIIYIETTGESYKNIEGLLYDEERAKWGLYFAVALAKITKQNVTIITPYVDQSEQMKYIFYRKFIQYLGKEQNLIRFTTIHKMLGSEAEHVIAILGKEHHPGEELRTIYFNEPELFNVQLTREKRTLTLIGNLQRLYKTASKYNIMERTPIYSNIRITIENIFELCGLELHSRRLRRKRDGEGGVYVNSRDLA